MPGRLFFIRPQAAGVTGGRGLLSFYFLGTGVAYMTYPHPIIAREGWPFIAAAFVVTLLIHAFVGFGWAWPFWLLTLFVVQFFRDPQRPVPQQPNAVLCPADGRIVAVETAHDPYVNRDALKISVFMNVFNVHSQRSPVDGAVTQVEYFPGAYLNAAIDKASLENERNAIVLQTADNHIVTSVQVAGLIARRILCYVRTGEPLFRGQRYGFIRFGSRVDVYLPLGSKPRVSIGEKVQASATILAEL
ncbi:phosphatidylserine decarboxylase [Burkholderia sp. b14]|nr:phosphatidylserine decarboxylase [Burkholderia sp. b14]